MAHLIHTMGSKKTQRAPFVSTFFPTQVPGLQIWLDGADPLGTGTPPSAGATVATWFNKSGNANNAIGVANPTFVSGGGILFNGTSQSYLINYPGLHTTETVFIVMKQSVNTTQEILHGGPGTCREVFTFNNLLYVSNRTEVTQPIFPNSINILGYTFSPSSTIVYSNATQTGSGAGSTGLVAESSVRIGAAYTSSTWYNGNIYEVIIFDTFLTTSQRQAVEGYLAWKWELQTSLPASHPYYLSQPTATSFTNVFSPLQIPALASWYDATDPYGTGQQPPTGTSISVWVDKSGNNRNLSQLGSYAVPIYNQNAINTLPTIDFTNSSGLYTPTTFAKSSNVTVLIVGNIKAASNGGTIWGHFTNPNNDIQLRRSANTSSISWHTNNDNTNLLTGTMNSPVLYSCTMTNGTAMFIQQTNTSGTSSLSYTTELSWTAGSASEYVGTSDSGEFIQSHISEILYFQYVLPTAQREVLEGYLAWKWGIRASLPDSHPYYSASPTQSSVSTSFSPLQFSGLQLWLDAADPLNTGTAPANSSVITTWYDKSGNANNAVNGVSPTYTNNSLVFNGSTTYLETPITANPINETIFIVFTLNAAAGSGNNDMFASSVTNGRGFQVIGNPAYLKYDVWGVGEFAPSTAGSIVRGKIAMGTGTYSGGPTGGTGTVYVNGGQYVGGPATFSTSGGGISRVGTGAAGDYYYGSISEIIYYNTVLTAAQRQAVEGYLAWKWNTYSSLPTNHPFKYFIPAYDSLQALTRSTYQASYLPGLQAWYDANDPFGTGVKPANAAVISNWFDKSGNSNTMEARGSPTYATASQNGLPGISIEGNSGTTIGTYYTTQIAPGTFLAEMDCFIIYKNTTSVTNNTLITRTLTSGNFGNPLNFMGTTVNVGLNSAVTITSSYNAFNTNTSLFNINISQATTATSKVTGYTNGTAITYTGGTTWTPSDIGSLLTLGSRASADTGFNGLFYEVMVFNYPLSTAQRQFVEGYLAWKWGLYASLPSSHPYYTASPNINTLLFQPNQIVGLNLWLDGADPLNTGVVPANGTAITTWFDKSPNIINAVGAASPTYVTGGGITFNGTNQYYDIPYSTKPNTETGFIILKATIATPSAVHQDILFNATSGTREIVLYNSAINLFNSGVGAITTGTLPLSGVTTLIGWAYNSASSVVYTNGVSGPVGAGFSPTAQTTMRLGSSATAQRFIGQMYEVIIFNTLLSTAQRQIVEGYLASKWNLQASLPALHPYYIAEPSLLTFVPSYTGTANISSNAATFIPLKTNTTDIGLYPRTVTTNGTISYSNVLGKNAVYFNNSAANFLSFPMSNVNGMTIAFWFNYTSTAYFTMASFTRTTASATMAIQFDLSSTTNTVFTALPSQWTIAPTATNLGANIWNFITVTINQNTFVETVYMNGSNASSLTGTGILPTTTDLFVIGRSGDNVRAYQGFIQNFMYFNTVLTGAQVNMLYKETSEDLTIPSPPTGLSLTFTNPTLSLSWTGSLNTTSYLIEFYGLADSGTSGGTLLQLYSNVTTTTQAFSGTPTSNFYYATVTPVNSGKLGAIVTSSALEMPKTVLAPTNVVMGSFTQGQTTISVSWTASVGAISYTINFLKNSSNSTTGGSVWQTFTGNTGTSQTSSTTLSSGINGTYYYATVTAVGGINSATATSSGTIFYNIASTVAGLTIWLDASDSTTYTLSGSTLATPGWKDKIGNRYFLPNNGGASNSVTATASPVLSNVSGYNSFFFNNASSSQSVGSFGLQANLVGAPIVLPTQNLTIFTVAQDQATNTNAQLRCILQIASGQTTTRPIAYFSLHTTSSEGWQVSHDFNGSTWGRVVTTNLPAASSAKRLLVATSAAAYTSLHTNGTITTSNTTVYNSPYTNYNMYMLGLAVNANGARVWGGYIHEVLIYNVALSDADRQMIEGNLAWKWGLQTTLPVAHPYYTYPPGFSASDIPASPTNVTMGAFAAQQTTISVSWTASLGATSYTINFLSNAANSTSGGTVWQTITGATGTTRASSTTLISGVNGTYYYATVAAVNAAGSSAAVTTSSTVFYHIPKWISGNVLWLDGNDQTNSAVISGNNVTQWRDKSGLNNHTNLTSPANPQKTTLNSLNAVSFTNSSATSNYMRGNLSATYGNSGYTLVSLLTMTNMTSGIAYPRVFLVGLGNTSTPGGGLLIRNGTRQEMAIYSNNILGGNINPTGTGNNVMVAKAVPAYASAFIMTHRVTATAAGCNLGELAINGNPIDGRFSGVASGNGRTFSNYSIANYIQSVAGFGDAYTGIYGEILLYNSNLTETQRSMVEGYLAWKWGTTATLNASHAYKNAAP